VKRLSRHGDLLRIELSGQDLYQALLPLREECEEQLKAGETLEGVRLNQFIESSAVVWVDLEVGR
jgi:hypothetical protein